MHREVREPPAGYVEDEDIHVRVARQKDIQRGRDIAARRKLEN